MEFPYDIKELFPDEISVVNNLLIASGIAEKRCSKAKSQIGHVVDVIGEASAKAQKLTKPITTKEKFSTSDDRIYIKRTSDKVVGFLKIGIKNLFLFDVDGNYHEIQPLCVLDFYVHETMQRQGSGKQLFDFMLEHESVKPHQLAINRPSAKFLSFLSKHYDLKSKIPQINNFVVFHNFFQGSSKNKRIWSYGEDDSWFSRLNADVVRQSRPVSLEGRIKLPNLEPRNISHNNPASLGKKSNARQSKLGSHQDSIDKSGKYFSTEVFDLSGCAPASNLRGNNSCGLHTSSACHLNRRLNDDTSWNIFGVTSSASRHNNSRISPGANQAKSSSMLRWCNE